MYMGWKVSRSQVRKDANHPYRCNGEDQICLYVPPMWETYVTLSYSELWLISWSPMIHTFLVEHVLNCFAHRGKGSIDYCRGFGILKCVGQGTAEEANAGTSGSQNACGIASVSVDFIDCTVHLIWPSVVNTACSLMIK